MSNIRRTSQWKTIHVLSFDGYPDTKYQLDDLGNHIKKFKKLIPRKRNDIYTLNERTESSFDDLTSPNLESDDLFDYKTNVQPICNYPKDASEKCNSAFSKDRKTRKSSKVIESQNDTIIKNDKTIAGHLESFSQLIIDDLTHSSESEELSLMEIYESFF